MTPSDLKIYLGLVVQSERLASEQGLLKLINGLPFERVRDIQDLVDLVNVTRVLKSQLELSELRNADKYLNVHRECGIQVIPFGDEKYPVCLAMTPNPPSMLYVRGNVDILNDMPGVAIVGSREFSAAGKVITERISSIISDEQLVIVSGLALGTDTNAHRAALNTNTKTIAVLAHGLELAKPRANSRLADEILEYGGAWISEYPMGRPAFKNSFVQRNRIQVGLSAVSILIEADLNSGTMTQADFALKAKRPIFAVVPHQQNNPLNLNCAGNEQLVLQGKANPLRTKYDYCHLLDVIKSSRDYIRNESIYFGRGQNESLI